VSQLTIKFGCAKNVAQYKITTEKSPQVLQNDYKQSGYDNNYKINLAISFTISRLTCTELNPLHKIKGKA
jgi:hypothetical protein